MVISFIALLGNHNLTGRQFIGSKLDLQGHEPSQADLATKGDSKKTENG